MPDHWTGPVEQRYERLDREGRRCDANGRHCTHGAIEEYLLRPATNGTPIRDAGPVRKLSCSRHKQLFTNNANYVVITTRRFPRLHNAG